MVKKIGGRQKTRGEQKVKGNKGFTHIVIGVVDILVYQETFHCITQTLIKSCRAVHVEIKNKNNAEYAWRITSFC